MVSTVNVLGVTFLDTNITEVISTIDEGGLLVVPSGPGMASINSDIEYAKSVQNADFAIADSGYMCLCLRLLRRKAPARISGLTLVRALLCNDRFLNFENILWILPSTEMVSSTTKLLISRGADMDNHRFEVAPFYKSTGPITDPLLLSKCIEANTTWVVIAVAGGKQEKLGAYLSANLEQKPTIICIGAALAFETRDQAPIPAWADHLYLGWLMRILSSPRLYTTRYKDSFKLFWHIHKSK